MPPQFPSVRVCSCRGPPVGVPYRIGSSASIFLKGVIWPSRGNGYRFRSNRIEGKNARLFLALLVVGYLVQHQHAYADEGGSFFGEWPSQTLKQLQGAFNSKLGFFGGAPQDPPPPTLSKGDDQTAKSFEVLQQQLASPLSNPRVTGGQEQWPATRVLDVFTPQQTARDAVSRVEGSLYHLHQLHSSIDNYFTSMGHRMASQQQEMGEAQPGYPWEPHECLQPYAVASSVVRAMEQRPVREALDLAWEAVARLVIPEEEGEGGGYPQGQLPSLNATELPSQSTNLLTSSPLSSPLDTEAELLQQQKQQRGMALGVELHGQLAARLGELEEASHNVVSVIQQKLNELFRLSDLCAMNAIGDLKERITDVSGAMEGLMAADAAFAASAASSLQQVLHMLGDRQTTERMLIDTNTALKEILEPAVEELQQREEQLGQQRLSLLDQHNKTREKLNLLHEAAAGIAKSGINDGASHGAPFCERLLREAIRLQPAQFESQLLQAQKLHHETLLDGMRELVQGLRSFLSSSAKSSEGEGGELSQYIKELEAMTQQLRQQERELNQLGPVTAGLRDAALQLASLIQTAMQPLHEKAAEGRTFSLPQVRDEPTSSLLALSSGDLLASMHQLQQQALQQVEKLSVTTECLKATAAAHLAATDAATAAAATANLFTSAAQGDKEGAGGPAFTSTAATYNGHEHKQQPCAQIAEWNYKIDNAETPRDAAGSVAASPLESDLVESMETGEAKEAGGNALVATPDTDRAATPPIPETHLMVVETTNAAAFGLRYGYQSMARVVMKLVLAAAATYSQIQQHIRAAIAAYESYEKLRSQHYKAREKQELRLVAEGKREHVRQQLKKRAGALILFATTGSFRNPRQH